MLNQTQRLGITFVWNCGYQSNLMACIYYYYFKLHLISYCNNASALVVHVMSDDVNHDECPLHVKALNLWINAIIISMFLTLLIGHLTRAIVIFCFLWYVILIRRKSLSQRKLSRRRIKL